MIHIKETEIIPFLKTAQTGYTKMISEGDLEMEVELAEREPPEIIRTATGAERN